MSAVRFLLRRRGLASASARAAMAVLLETSKGDIVVDLYVEECPRTCLNFLKLCK